MAQHTGGHDYTDAFTLDLRADVALAEFIRAFYTTWLFRAEGIVLSLSGARPVPADLEAIAIGSGGRFAAWSVMGRTPTEILLADMSGHTRSWLSIEPLQGRTQLWFGSAVMAKPLPDGTEGLGRFMSALIPVHRFYSKALLSSAARRLRQI